MYQIGKVINMRVKRDKIDEWAHGCAINTDPYGNCVYKFADAWAIEMEKHLDNGETIEQCAEKTQFEVDERSGFGITGFMYGCVVAILAKVWEHGEELRKWHNLKTQIGKEGERANESGGVLNPAILSFGGSG